MEVELIRLDGRPVLRASQTVGETRYLLGYCQSVQELTRLGIDLADLVEVNV
ncbi:hypothetical protein ACFWYW_46820 [Nonomuraea sp. NPDC059023]|uniref:hypothetical protein n=1 Tax=unclassified Nonomuraea TaxID=2593643 RepID=UPI003673C983